jgi:hypothetical protein
MSLVAIFGNYYRYTSNFSPATDVSGLQAWFDGADPSGNGIPPTNGVTVSIWYDKSGNGRNTSSVVGTPTYTLGTGIVFNGSSYYLLPNNTIPFGDSSYSIYVIARVANATGGCGLVGGGVTSTDQELLLFAGSDRFLYNFWYDGNDLKNTLTFTVGSTFLFGSLYQSAGNKTAFFNGSAAGSKTPTAARSQPNTGNVIGTNVPTQVGNTILNGSISEILVYNINHTTQQRQITEGYLAWKWGIQTLLPTSHPYYSVGP